MSDLRKFYHGTGSGQTKDILENGIRLDAGRADADFGLGFSISRKIVARLENRQGSCTETIRLSCRSIATCPSWTVSLLKTVMNGIKESQFAVL